MDNWAFENRDNLTGDPFAPSYFSEAVVPGPAAALPFALGLLVARRRRRK
jgi:MYXO-CTERM domain-containing protein